MIIIVIQPILYNVKEYEFVTFYSSVNYNLFIQIFLKYFYKQNYEIYIHLFLKNCFVLRFTLRKWLSHLNESAGNEFIVIFYIIYCAKYRVPLKKN